MSLPVGTSVHTQACTTRPPSFSKSFSGLSVLDIPGTCHRLHPSETLKTKSGTSKDVIFSSCVFFNLISTCSVFVVVPKSDPDLWIAGKGCQVTSTHAQHQHVCNCGLGEVHLALLLEALLLFPALASSPQQHSWRSRIGKHTVTANLPPRRQRGYSRVWVTHSHMRAKFSDSRCKTRPECLFSSLHNTMNLRTFSQL